MCRPSITRRLLSGALVLLAAAPLDGQSAAPAPARKAQRPAAYAAIREADLRRDVGEMAGPAMRGR